MSVKCLIWGTGLVYSQYINAIRYHELLGEIEVIGVTSNLGAYTDILGYPFICKESISQYEFDIVVVMAEHTTFSAIQKEAMEINIPSEKIISYKILLMPSMDIKKYIQLKNNTPTIFANNCWGGLTYHRLGLEFNSPFINMFETDEDYLKILENPSKYMDIELTYIEDRFEPVLKRYYPVCRCGDVLLYFNHYTSFDEANNSWIRRKKRIQWNNLFIMMLTENEDIARKFSKLPYSKKVCFVPFNMDVPSLVQVKLWTEQVKLIELFSTIVNGMASGAYSYYDPIELLLNCNLKLISKTI